MKRAIYAFSGDPITFGHLDIIERAAKVFDELIVGIGINPAKQYLFSLEERTQLAQKAVTKWDNVQVKSFKGLLVDFAFENDISVIVRGLRNSEDFNFEVMLHQIGESQAMKIDTFFLPSRQQLAHISSGAAKALQMEQGMLHDYVPLHVKQKLEERLSGQYLLGITGEIGAGKSFLCDKLKVQMKEEGIETHRIDMDTIGHEILETLIEPLFVRWREELVHIFGEKIRGNHSFINRKALGKIIFTDKEKLDLFNQMIYKPLLLRLRRAMYGKKGLILLDSALISETNMAFVTNNHVVVVKTSLAQQQQRLQTRGYSDDQIQRRVASQFSYEKKKQFLQEQIKENGYGRLFVFDNSETEGEDSFLRLKKELLSHFEVPILVYT